MADMTGAGTYRTPDGNSIEWWAGRHRAGHDDEQHPDVLGVSIQAEQDICPICNGAEPELDRLERDIMQAASIAETALGARAKPDARQRAESIVDELLKRATDAERARVNLLTYDYDRPETHHAQAWPRMQDAVRRLEAVRSQIVTLLEAGFTASRRAW